MRKELAIDYIKNNNIIGIKAGITRPNFLDIWMVVVDDRIFARSWGFAEKSWYNSFLQDPIGEINCGEQVFSIKAVVPIDNEVMTEKINNAYLTKYHSEHNIKYAKGIIEENHIEKTMEFLIDQE